MWRFGEWHKTSITSIKGRIESLNTIGEQFSKNFWQDMVERVNSNTQHLVFLCATFLQLSIRNSTNTIRNSSEFPNTNMLVDFFYSQDLPPQFTPLLCPSQESAREMTESWIFDRTFIEQAIELACNAVGEMDKGFIPVVTDFIVKNIPIMCIQRFLWTVFQAWKMSKISLSETSWSLTSLK